MKQILFMLIALFFLTTTQGQILNGSFENGLNPDLSSWDWTCFAQSDSSTPPGGGNWSIQVAGGNTQGCFPGYAYQKLPMITTGQSYILSGWAFALSAPPVGLYFGKTNSGIITLQSGATTSSPTWTQLSIQSNFSLLTGDTAVVVLDAGLAGGPLQGYGYFDLITLQQVTGIYSSEKKPFINIYPNPFTDLTTIRTAPSLLVAKLTMTNTLGQTVKQMVNIDCQDIILERNNLPEGLYFIHISEDDKLIATEKIVVND